MARLLNSTYGAGKRKYPHDESKFCSVKRRNGAQQLETTQVQDKELG